MPNIQFVNTIVPDGTTARVMLLESLANRALVMPVNVPQDEAYAFSVWLKASAAGSVNIELFGNTEQVTVGTAWQRVSMVVNSRDGNEVRLTPRTDAGYYIYRAMLETGNKPGDWSPSPEDDAESIVQIQQSLIQLTPQNIILTVMSSDEMGEVEGNISALGGRVTTAEGNVTTLGGRVTTAEGNVTSLGNRVTTAEGNVTTLGGRVTGVEGTLTNGVPKVRTSSVVIDSDGIDMSGGEINIQAGAAFNVESGGTFQINADGTGQTDNFINLGNKFIVSEDGDLTCTQATVDEMKVNGYDPWTRENLIVASEKPDITPCIWLQPNGTTAITLQGEEPSTTAYLNVAQSISVERVTGGTLPGGVTYNYTLTTSIGNTSSDTVRNLQLRATISDGTNTVTGFQSEVFQLGAKSSRVVTMSVYGSTTNVCGTNVPVTVTYSLAAGNNRIRVNPAYRNTLVVETRIQSGVTPCALYWCP